MTFKEFVLGTLRLPATIVGGISTILFGDYDRNDDGTAKKEGAVRGLLGLVLDAVKFIGRTITNSLKDHKDAIASAFWLSLLAAGAAAAAVAFLPAALAAVTGFTIAGYSIGAFFTGFAAQVAATAGVAVVLTSAAVYSVATAANFCSFVYNCCCGSDCDDLNNADDEQIGRSARAMSKLGLATSGSSSSTQPPQHGRQFTTRFESNYNYDDYDNENDTPRNAVGM